MATCSGYITKVCLDANFFRLKNYDKMKSSDLFCIRWFGSESRETKVGVLRPRLL